MAIAPTNASSFMVYADESGDHSLEHIEPTFPVFVLSLCIFRKADYITKVVPSFQDMKFRYFGHDLVVFHEREIYRQTGHFSILRDKSIRDPFMVDLNRVITDAPFTLISACIDKRRLTKSYSDPDNPYHIAMGFCLERVFLYLNNLGEGKKLTHIAFECRGEKEDKDLELAFRRSCDSNATGKKLNFEPIFAPKTVNSTGLQFADLISRPVGRHIIDPAQPNRAYDIISTKFYRKPGGSEMGWGLKCFP